MLVRRLNVIAVAIAASVLVASCGGGDTGPSGPTSSSPTTSSPATVTAPAAYDLATLKAAMPTQADLPAGTTLSRVCPGGGEGCDMYPETLAVAEIRAEPASPEGAARVKDQATPLDFVSVQGAVYDDAASATAATESGRAAGAEYEGSYEITANGRTSRGVGSTVDAAIGQWKGASSRRTEKSSDSADDEGLLVASLTLANGTNRAGAFVSLSAAGRDPDAAVDLADRLVREYLDRLQG